MQISENRGQSDLLYGGIQIDPCFQFLRFFVFFVAKWIAEFDLFETQDVSLQ